MTHLPQAAVSRVGHQDVAHHPCSRVPSVPGLVDPEEVDVPVEVGLWRLSQEHWSFIISIRSRLTGSFSSVLCVPLSSSPSLPSAAGPLEVVDKQRPGHYPAAHGVLRTLRA